MNFNRLPGRIINILWVLFLLLLLITGSGVDPADQMEQIRSFSRVYEFDYVTWTVSALARKFSQSALEIDRYLPLEDQRALIFDYLDLKNQTDRLQYELSAVIADPDQENRPAQEAAIREALEGRNTRREQLAPFVEQVLQGLEILGETDRNLGYLADALAHQRRSRGNHHLVQP